MTATAEAIKDKLEEPVENPSTKIDVRRFMYGDINEIGPWLLPRMLQAYPELSESAAVGWLKGFVVNNEYLFLRQPNAVMLAQLMPGYTLVPAQIVQERFVWVKDKTDKQQVEHAAQLYGHLYEWASKLAGVQHIIVDENTDVPRNLIEKTIDPEGKRRIFERKMSYVGIKGGK